MNQFKEKLRLIYLPFLLIATSFILLYTFLNWAIIIKGNFGSLKQMVINLWLPFALPWIPVLIWLRPRINLLRLKKENAAFGFQFIAVLAIAAPTIISQEYLEKATGKLTALKSIDQYNDSTATKYYSLQNRYIDKAHVSVYPVSNVSGKSNGTLTFSIFVAMPLYEKVADTANKKCECWLVKKYSESINNHISDEQKDAKYHAFAEETQVTFDSTDFTKFVYLERLGNTEEHDGFNAAIAKNTFLTSEKPVVFVAYNEPFENRNGETFPWIFKAFGIGAMIFLVFVAIPHFDDDKLNRFLKGVEEKEESTSLKDTLEMFIPRHGYYATPILIDLNVLVFFIMVFAGLGIISFKATDLLHWGANFRPFVADGQWWRLLTSTFLHGGLMHIVANMIGLVFVGLFLEPAIGTRRFAIFYIVTGIFASIASIWWHAATVSVGASGAIFGMYGVFLALLLKKVFPAALNKAFLTSTLIFVGFNLAMGFAGGIDNAAHIGGLVSGFVIGLIIAPTIKSEIEQKSQEEEPEDIEAEMYS
ncbi:rhomboid family intramembrane serine protease [Pinibacter aurantiacus]|uniref:Rhomboid family intramembrane serine protease n=1 Tax=Pinibacter aurantiacus TaxID=2851599 RepID=A0A9E2S9W8_9BACT|nr:rhomboid family intramembrane serine protease [Pinibacter aurantiacus]MBV4358616.1 rhomboid family intramembrane serine protease [Pinibacter aurantiacus]